MDSNPLTGSGSQMAYYSRKKKVQERKDIRRTVLFIFLTVVFIVAFFFYGLPVVIRYTAVLTDIRKTDEPIETQDTTSPPPPKFEDVPDYTNKENIDVRGNTEPGADVTIYYNSQEQEVLANSDGIFTYTFSLQDGVNTFYAISKDSSGNESQKSESQKIIFDSEPPEFEVTSPEDGKTFYGSKERQIVIQGTTEKNARVKINDRWVVVESDGSFAYATSLSEGDNTFKVVAEDEAGNQTEKEMTLKFNP